MDINKIIGEAIKQKIAAFLSVGDTKHNNDTEVVGKTCVIRSYAAGVFVGDIVEEKYMQGTKEVILNNCIRIHYWDGACSLSQLAMEGVKKPENCRFSVRTNNHKVINVVEIIVVTDVAKKNLYKVETWAK